VDIEAVVFDMDGVLVDSEPLHFRTTNEVLARRGAALDEAGYEGFKGMAEGAFFEALVARFGLSERPEALDRARALLDTKLSDSAQTSVSELAAHLAHLSC